MKVPRIFAQAISVFPIAWAATFVAVLLMATVKLGHIPEYLGDEKPHLLFGPSFGVFLGFVNVIILGICLLSVPVWLLILAYLLAKRAELYRSEKILYSGAIAALLVFTLFHSVLTSQCDWYFD